MDRRTYIATAGAALASVGLAGCNEANDAGAQDADDQNGNQSDDELDWEEAEAEIGETPDSIKVTGSTLVETQDGAAVIATVKNTGENPYSFVEVEVTLNDGDTVIGEWVDTTEEELDGLAAGETWRFMATFEGEDVYNATGYTITIEGDVEQEEGDGAGDDTDTNGTPTDDGTPTGNGTPTGTGSDA